MSSPGNRFSDDGPAVRPSELLALLRRVDGLEAAVGELRALLELERARLDNAENAPFVAELQQRLATLERAIGADQDVP